MKTFHDKVAVITGAGGGIGHEFAVQLARSGYHLALADIDESQLLASLNDLPPVNTLITSHIVDVSNSENYLQFVEDVIARHGRVDLIINNAGITLQRSFENHRIEDWQRVLGVNLWGVIHGCKYFLPHLKQSTDAHIVNMSSMAGYLGLPNQSSYSATKAAVRSISESLATELAHFGIHVTSVHPGAIATNMINNTLALSDDIDNAKRNLQAAQKIAMPAEQAVAKILQAVHKKKTSVRIGKDAVLLNLLIRFMPATTHAMINRAVRKRRRC